MKQLAGIMGMPAIVPLPGRLALGIADQRAGNGHGREFGKFGVNAHGADLTGVAGNSAQPVAHQPLVRFKQLLDLQAKHLRDRRNASFRLGS